MADLPDPHSKRSVARIRRLTTLLESGLTDAAQALELLVAELEAGDAHEDLWEKLHAAAVRDEKDFELSAAYDQLARGRRLKALTPEAQERVLMRAADFLGGVLGDAEAAVVFLERVITANPEHAEAFARLERRFTTPRDDRRMAELLATVVAGKREGQALRVGRALSLIDLLPPEQAVSLEACEKLVRAGGKSPRNLMILEGHCKKGKRFKEAAALLEVGLAGGELDSADAYDVRRRAIALYLGDAKAPELAMSHIEELLRIDPSNVEARKAAERLLVHSGISGRAAAALQDARRRAPHES
jgi:tetratricopeptide (TPR) repeat protein